MKGAILLLGVVIVTLIGYHKTKAAGSEVAALKKRMATLENSMKTMEQTLFSRINNMEAKFRSREGKTGKHILIILSFYCD